MCVEKKEPNNVRNNCKGESDMKGDSLEEQRWYWVILLEFLKRNEWETGGGENIHHNKIFR